MTPRRQRIIAITLILAGVSAAAALGLTALSSNILFFYTPTQLLSGEVPPAAAIRLGGLVTKGSVKRTPDSLKISFDLTDQQHTVRVRYEGLLPDLFREGQGIVAQGRLAADRVFNANEVLAKHDENYMPPELAAHLPKVKDTAP
ncbi:MAG: Cytochrome c-type biogenesis protein CcmE [Chromatiales bacterium USCg_Taylor]|nr:MAG: Cytochrome c-type biogenesis protein CcmE [Chromatiales bacterium USCg_Taylor]